MTYYRLEQRLSLNRDKPYFDPKTQVVDLFCVVMRNIDCGFKSLAMLQWATKEVNPLKNAWNDDEWLKSDHA